MPSARSIVCVADDAIRTWILTAHRHAERFKRLIDVAILDIVLEAFHTMPVRMPNWSPS